jgi:hypothetical protein
MLYILMTRSRGRSSLCSWYGFAFTSCEYLADGVEVDKREADPLFARVDKREGKLISICHMDATYTDNS